jgi:hypothetical protein
MGRAKRRHHARVNSPVKDAWKRERPTHHQAPPPLNVDVHGVLFAVVFVVFVVYPLAQWALGR